MFKQSYCRSLGPTEVRVVISATAFGREGGRIIVAQYVRNDFSDLVPLRDEIGLNRSLPSAQDRSDVGGAQPADKVADTRNDLRICCHEGGQLARLTFVRWLRSPSVPRVVPALQMAYQLGGTHACHLFLANRAIRPNPACDARSRYERLVDDAVPGIQSCQLCAQWRRQGFNTDRRQPTMLPAFLVLLNYFIDLRLVSSIAANPLSKVIVASTRT